MLLHTDYFIFNIVISPFLNKFLILYLIRFLIIQADDFIIYCYQI